MHIDKSIMVSSIADKLPPSWKGNKRTLMHKKEEISLENLANYLHVEEELCIQDESKEYAYSCGQMES